MKTTIRRNLIKYEAMLLEQFKKDKEIADNELAITARKFLNNPRELRLVIEVINSLPIDTIV